MEEFLLSFAALPTPVIGLIFLAENALLTVAVLVVGRYIQWRVTPGGVTLYAHTRREWLICIGTNVINTAVTYAGFRMWTDGFITITYETSWMIVVDFLLLFLAMDLLMYAFHRAIHQTFLYRLIHQLHHQAVHPRPLDLFILHPVETVSFGSLWLFLLVLYPFNIYAVIVYLGLNLISGLVGHLGIEPLPGAVRNLPVIRYLGTSTFHHDHHEDPGYNFGFYTSIWDRLFGTLRKSA